MLHRGFFLSGCIDTLLQLKTRQVISPFLLCQIHSNLYQKKKSEELVLGNLQIAPLSVPQ